MKKAVLVLTLLLSAASLSAGGSGNYALNFGTDAALLGASAAVNLGGLYFTSVARSPSAADPSSDSVRDWTRWPVFRFDGVQDDVTTFLAFGLPATAAVLPDRYDLSESVVIGTMLLETLTLTWGTKEILKGLFPKYRPYVYAGDYPEKFNDDPDRYFAFPSGHTAIAFSTAAFVTSVYARSEAGPVWKAVVGAGSFAVAGAVAVLRMTSGNHYLVDVVAGALIGTAYGLLVPALHARD